jgi:NADPH:quinone reductase-like Zn-dependent oxidoreductase
MSWVFTERGELSKILKLEDAEVDPPKTAEITIEVYAVAVNPVDVQM